MSAVRTKLARWRADPAAFIEHVLHNPETGKPFTLLPAERVFLQHAFKRDAAGRLLYPEQVFGAPKKSGKTGFAALHMLTTVLLFGGRFAEGYALANDLDQAQSRVFRGGPGCLNRFSASISGASARVRLPSGVAAG